MRAFARCRFFSLPCLSPFSDGPRRRLWCSYACCFAASIDALYLRSRLFLYSRRLLRSCRPQRSFRAIGIQFLSFYPYSLHKPVLDLANAISTERAYAINAHAHTKVYFPFMSAPTLNAPFAPRVAAREGGEHDANPNSGHTAAIVGAVVGSIAVVLLAATAAWYSLRARRGASGRGRGRAAAPRKTQYGEYVYMSADAKVDLVEQMEGARSCRAVESGAGLTSIVYRAAESPARALARVRAPTGGRSAVLLQLSRRGGRARRS